MPSRERYTECRAIARVHRTEATAHHVAARPVDQVQPGQWGSPA